jgi:hypothetical protein
VAIGEKSASDLLLLLKPYRPFECRFVCGSVMTRDADVIENLPNKRCLADLPRSHNGLDESPRFLEACVQGVKFGSLVLLGDYSNS